MFENEFTVVAPDVIERIKRNLVVVCTGVVVRIKSTLILGDETFPGPNFFTIASFVTEKSSPSNRSSEKSNILSLPG